MQTLQDQYFSSEKQQKESAKVATKPKKETKKPFWSSDDAVNFEPVYQEWKGAPYQLGGTSKQGIDCSAFVQTAYKDAADVNLPRTTEQQVEVGSFISSGDEEPGDLVFFKTSAWGTKHVGIYLGNQEFLHASTSKGVIKSRLDNPYWADAFWQFRRLPN
ncbi:NlpC/P60 family protein [Vibrio sp.]|nr:NlpC/P60 family protein [Vibrio sp.]